MSLLRRYARSPAAIVGLLLLVVVLLMAASAGMLFPRDPLALAGRPLQWPFDNTRLPLGTDGSGRDIAAQIFHGARISLLIGFAATIVAITIGVVMGALAGFYGGAVDTILMRITEAFQTLPNFLLLLVLVAVFGSKIETVTVAIGLVSWPAPARNSRGPSSSHSGRASLSRRHARSASPTARSSSARSSPTHSPGDRLRERRHGGRHPARERARLPQPFRPQRRLVGQPDRPGPQRHPRAVVRLGDPGRSDPAHGARRLPRRPGPQRRLEPEAGRVPLWLQKLASCE